MDRDEFTELVYETFTDEPDNVLANGIIEAADAYVEHEKAQLSMQGTTSDLISKFIDGLEEIFADIRERHVDDSVCGLCEYDGAYMGQSGDWCNECPGFDRDDCFKLSDETRKKWTDEIIKALPNIQPEPHGGHWVDGRCNKCGGQAPFWVMASTYYESDFCPHCGARMKGERYGEL